MYHLLYYHTHNVIFEKWPFLTHMKMISKKCSQATTSWQKNTAENHLYGAGQQQSYNPSSSLFAVSSVTSMKSPKEKLWYWSELTQLHSLSSPSFLSPTQKCVSRYSSVTQINSLAPQTWFIFHTRVLVLWSLQLPATRNLRSTPLWMKKNSDKAV